LKKIPTPAEMAEKRASARKVRVEIAKEQLLDVVLTEMMAGARSIRIGAALCSNLAGSLNDVGREAALDLCKELRVQGWADVHVDEDTLKWEWPSEGVDHG
jgi:hypothetical protein